DGHRTVRSWFVAITADDQRFRTSRSEAAKLWLQAWPRYGVSGTLRSPSPRRAALPLPPARLFPPDLRRALPRTRPRVRATDPCPAERLGGSRLRGGWLPGRAP